MTGSTIHDVDSHMVSIQQRPTQAVPNPLLFIKEVAKYFMDFLEPGEMVQETLAE
jgi:hypothetical protein